MNDNGGSMQNMTLRDWFAGQVLAGELSAEVLPTKDSEAKALAALCYKLADAMIAERDK